MARKPNTHNGAAAPEEGSPEARLDGKLKAMFEAIERRSGPSVLPDLGSLPKARRTDRRN